MLESLNAFIEKLNSAKNYISLKIYVFLSFLTNLLYKIFGENRITYANDAINNGYANVQNKFFSHLNDEGEKYPIIRKAWGWFYRLFFGIIIFIFLLKTNFLWLTGGMPSIEQLQNPKLSQASTIFSADGVVIGKYFTENRVPVDSAAISPWVFKSLIATEDKRFFDHSGIDVKRMAGVFVGLLTGSNDQGGGSTISQQLAKNLYNTRKKEMRGFLYNIPIIKTLVYKTKEWITAIELEKRFTKGEIATLYLNTVDYGNNTFGIKTAAKTYFNKATDKLTVSEAAVLVGLQKATTYYNPIRNPENSIKRRNTVLQRLVANGDLSSEEAEKLSKQKIKLDINNENSFDGQGNYFKEALKNYVEKWAEENDQEIDLYTDGLNIHTTIDSRMQTYAEGAMEQHMRMLQKEFNNQWKDKNPWTYETGEEIPDFIENAAKKTEIYAKFKKRFSGNLDSVNKYMNKPIPMSLFSWDGNVKTFMSPIDSIKYYKKFLQAGSMSFDPYSGFIKTWVGGIDFEHFQYDHVKQGKRQPGSVFKPIMYTSAIDGPMDLCPCDKRQDKKLEFKWKENGEEKIWAPKNANGKFSNRDLTLRTALARSVNSVAVQLTMEVLPKTVIEYARKMGIKSPLDNVGSLGLGTSDVSLFEMVGAYGVFLNEGEYREPIFVFKIEDKSGKILHEFEPIVKEAIKPESAFLMQYMLRGNIEEAGGTGRRMLGYQELFKNGGQVAGKTGTTSNNSDAWYVGFTKDLVCGVWVGGDDRSIHFKGGLGEGSKSALPIFGIFMNNVYKDENLKYKAGPFAKPAAKIEKDYTDCRNYRSAGGGRGGVSRSSSRRSQSDTLVFEYEEDTTSTRPRTRFSDTSGVNINRIRTSRPRTDSSSKKEIKIDN
jgi:penicillin-binding protein 1A